MRDGGTAQGCDRGRVRLPARSDVLLDRFEDIASRFAGLGFGALALGDATGMATPLLVLHLQSVLPQMPLVLHLHNSHGGGLVNILEGLALGVTGFESSLARIGGCSFAPCASGNICTEDTVCLLQELGIDPEKLRAVAPRLEQVLGRTLQGQAMRAGPRLRKCALADQGTAVG